MSNGLPAPREDGLCADCQSTKRKVVCKVCLRRRCAEATPGSMRPAVRRGEREEAYEGDPSPWQENAVRALEDSR